MMVFKEMFVANLKELIRDRAGMFWLIAFPVIFVFIFGIVFSGGGEQTFQIGIITESESAITENIINGISSQASFDVWINKDSGLY